MKRRPNDKILDNKYNAGEIDYEVYSNKELKVNSEYASDNLNSYYDSDKYTKHLDLLKFIDNIILDSYFVECMDHKRKIPKAKYREVFLFIVEKLNDNTVSAVEIIIAICEYFGANYQSMLSEIPIQWKEKILVELDSDHNIFARIPINKLL